MNSNKFFLGGIVGGVVYFVLGYLFYGLLLKSFFDANTTTPIDMSKMIWWALIVANLLAGFLFSYIIGKAKASNMGSAAGIGFVVGLLMALSYDLMAYSMNTGMSTSLKAICVDAITAAVMSAIAGAAIGWVYGMGKKPAA